MTPKKLNGQITQISPIPGCGCVWDLGKEEINPIFQVKHDGVAWRVAGILDAEFAPTFTYNDFYQRFGDIVRKVRQRQMDELAELDWSKMNIKNHIV